MSMFLLYPPALIELLFLCICGFASSHIQLVKSRMNTQSSTKKNLQLPFLRKVEKVYNEERIPNRAWNSTLEALETKSRNSAEVIHLLPFLAKTQRSLIHSVQKCQQKSLIISLEIPNLVFCLLVLFVFVT